MSQTPGPLSRFSVGALQGGNLELRIGEPSGTLEAKVTLSPQEAGDLASALLGSLAGMAQAAAGGTAVQGPFLALQRWRTGNHKQNGQPVLMVQAPGGPDLWFQMSPQDAEGCGLKLSEAAQLSRQRGL
jgi:hypothetical protein